MGTASIAHSAVETDEPISEGLVSLLEPFIDTMIICTLTSLVIITTLYTNDPSLGNLEGIAITSAAFAFHIDWFPVVLGIAASLFAFSTAIAWAYYGLKSWTYIFGESRLRARFQDDILFICLLRVHDKAICSIRFFRCNGFCDSGAKYNWFVSLCS